MTSDANSGFYGLTYVEIYEEAKNLYAMFFAEQTPINAFKLSIMMYHLLEWICPGVYERNRLEEINAKEEKSASDHLVIEVTSHRYYKILRGLANGAKHYRLTRTQPYPQSVERGFILGKSCLGERLGQENLVVEFEGESVWIRQVFTEVLEVYSSYFNKR
jgi:hypothetical protein